MSKIMRSVLFSKRCICLSVAIIPLIPLSTHAASWRADPAITLEQQYDDNLRLETGPHESVNGTLLKGSLGLSKLTENSEITGKMFLNFSNYSGGDDNDVSNNDDNQFFTLASNYSTELTRWAFDGSLRRDSTLRTVETSEDLPIDDVDDGLVSTNFRRYTLIAAPSWQRQLDERSNLAFGYKYTYVNFEDNIFGSGLFDYDRHGLSTKYAKNLSERDIFRMALGVSRYESTENFNNVVDSVDVTFGYQRSFTETSSGFINIGMSRASQESDLGSSDSNGFILNMQYEFKTERNRFRISLEHDLQPSGVGSLNEASQLKLNVNHGFTENVSGILNARYVEKDTIESTTPVKRKFFIVSPAISWRFNRWAYLSGGYNYRSNQRGTNAERADSNAVFISISHRKPITFD